MSRKKHYYKARLEDALENAVVNRQNVYGGTRSEAGRELMRLGAGLNAPAPVIRPAWADGSLDAIDELLISSGNILKAVRGLKECAVAALGDDLERRGKVGALVDKTYEIYRKLDALHQTLLGLDEADLEQLRAYKFELETQAAQENESAALILKLMYKLGI
jgi:hypothetical protein